MVMSIVSIIYPVSIVNVQITASNVVSCEICDVTCLFST